MRRAARGVLDSRAAFLYWRSAPLWVSGSVKTGFACGFLLSTYRRAVWPMLASGAMPFSTARVWGRGAGRGESLRKLSLVLWRGFPFSRLAIGAKRGKRSLAAGHVLSVPGSRGETLRNLPLYVNA